MVFLNVSCFPVRYIEILPCGHHAESPGSRDSALVGEGVVVIVIVDTAVLIAKDSLVIHNARHM